MLKLRPLTENDVKVRFESELLGVTSLEAVYGVSVSDKTVESRAEAHVRYYIKLQEDTPVINPITCGSGYKKAAKILGISTTKMSAIADFTYAWDDSKSALMEADLCTTPKYNGACLQKLIDEFDIEANIESILLKLISSEFPSGTVLRVVPSEDGVFQIYGGFGVMLPPGEEIEDFQQLCINARNKMINIVRTQPQKVDRLGYLVNLYYGCSGSVSAVRSYLSSVMLIKNVPVLPLSLRPSVAGRRHPLTTLYQQLFQDNVELDLFRKNPDDYKEHYSKIVTLVTTALCDNTQLSDFASLDTLLKRFKAKETGIVRSTMLKKRQDYSGRAAVIAAPYLPMNVIGIPKGMAVKMYRRYLTTWCKMDPEQVIERIDTSEFEDVAIKALIKEGVIDNVPILLGRNPTLHKHGIQGFHTIVTDSRAIHVSPLVCPAFNMDFDGDSAHDHVPLFAKSAEEISKLVMTDKNIMLPKTGQSTICPEKDIVYGLYVCTKEYADKSPKTFNLASQEELLEKLYGQKIYVWDLVTVPGYKQSTAGKVAVMSCFPKSYRPEDITSPISKKNIRSYVEDLEGCGNSVFCNSMNRLVELGMKIAYLYNKSVSSIDILEGDKDYNNILSDFHKRVAPIYELNDLGMYSSDSFCYDLGEELNSVIHDMQLHIKSKLPDNMYIEMMESGARGNISNLVQMFGCKGQVMKNASEVFNVLLENSMNSQLTPMEASINAYGARKGQIAKSIKTADTGYMGRKLNHATDSIIITRKDCGTNKGFAVDFNYIRSKLITENTTEADSDELNKKAGKVYMKMLEGRYQAGTNVLITKRMAEDFLSRRQIVYYRSPITCEDPCCAMCYGISPDTKRLLPKGYAAGLIASTSLGEPSTQLTMQEFHSGGVADATSPFDRLDAIISQSDIRVKSADGYYHTYDPVAWAPGTLVSQPLGGGKMLLRIVPDNTDDSVAYDYTINRSVPSTVLFKIGQHVNVGDTLRVEAGDSYVTEVLRYAGLEAAQREMLYSVYFLFIRQVDLMPIHIEVLISSITTYTPVYSKYSNIKYGKYYTRRQLIDYGFDDEIDTYVPSIRGVLRTVLGSPNFMQAIIMEDAREGISEAVFNMLDDVNDSPLVQLATGQDVKVGTGINPNYMEEI